MDSEVTNLAAVKAFDPTDYATAAQGALADSALQSGDNISTLTNDAGYTTNTGTVTSVAATAGTGISISGSPITTSGTLTITNTAPDQTVSLTQGSNVTITGTYPNFTIASTDTNTTYSAGTGLSLAGTTFSTVQNIATTATPTFAGGTFTGNVSFGDNDKAIFGAGSDLEIYHDGSNSLIRDTGTGDLQLRGSHVALMDAGGNHFIYCTDTGTGGTVEIKHLGATKLATTATGIDVTGTVNVTTVDLGNWTITESAGVLYFATGGTNKMKLDASGNLTVTGDVTAYGSV
jgi:hypothetical protein